jgi:molecular chaperone GrpE
MDFNNELEDNNGLIEIVEENSLSIEDFIKELEAKEKDLHISSDLAIEIDESDFDDTNPEFIKAEFAIEPVKAPEPKPPMPGGAPNNKTISVLEDQVSQFKQQVSKLETERAELAETMRRRQLDFDNYKKRIERDRSETYLNQISNLASQMLPVLDNLNRALDFAVSHSEGRSADFHHFLEGIVLVNQQLNEVLASMGIAPIASVGESFDPHFHEAVATETSDEFPPNLVTGELLRGYRLGDKVIRAAMVKVSIPGVSPAANNFSSANNLNSEDDVLET